MTAKLLLSCLGSLVITLLIARLLPVELVAPADVIGYPIFHDYNGPRLIQLYWLLVAAFPLLSFALFSITQRNRITFPAEPVESAPRGHAIWLLARVFIVGWILSLGGVGIPLIESKHYTIQSALLTASYVALACAAALAWRRLGRAAPSLRRALSHVNAIGALLSVVALYGVSRAAIVKTPDAPPHTWPFFPLPLLIAILGIGGALLVRAMRRAHDDTSRERVEVYTVYTAALPVLVYLLNARVPGEMSHIDLFHVGETVASAELVSKGFFPFRDLLFIHGLFEDPGRSWLSFQLFERSIWGAAAGQQLLFAPLVWVSAYFMYLGLFRDQRIVVLLGGVLLPVLLPPARLTEVTRYLLFPWMTLCFLWLLQRRSVARAVLFAIIVFVQTLLIPELTLAVPGFILALALLEGQQGRDLSPWSRLLRTRWVATVGICLTIGLALYLHRHGALRGFIDYFRIFGRGHLLKGAYPIQPGPWHYYLRIAIPITAFIGGAWWFFLSLRYGRKLAPRDHIGLALLVFGVAYFQKFLWRADPEHLFLTFLFAAPFVFFVVEKLLRYAGSKISLGLLGATILVALPNFLRTTNDYAQHIAPSLPAATEKRLGYADPQSPLVKTVRTLRPLLDKLAARDGLFDFSNQPALYYFLLDAQPNNPFFHVSMAISRESQALLIKSLIASPPPYVIYHSPYELWHWDDVPNSVRHEDVSEYLLRNYEPLPPVADQLILRRRGAAGPPAIEPRRAYLELTPCDWGFVPHFDGPPSASLRELGTWIVQTDPRTPSSPFITMRIARTDAGQGGLSDGSYLELSFEDLKADHFALHDGTQAANTSPIAFRSRAAGRRVYYLHVGACPQWHAFSSNRLVLRATQDHGLRSVRLLGH